MARANFLDEHNEKLNARNADGRSYLVVHIIAMRTGLESLLEPG